ncbi:hypothetical protein BDZ91DRAFT_779206 [Kalaharituber pfeilii]|nr:hypothetical protein BDZ91DRAFT_779206 [Kalaharituber pfeilii]
MMSAEAVLVQIRSLQEVIDNLVTPPWRRTEMRGRKCLERCGGRAKGWGGNTGEEGRLKSRILTTLHLYLIPHLSQFQSLQAILGTLVRNVLPLFMGVEAGTFEAIEVGAGLSLGIVEAGGSQGRRWHREWKDAFGDLLETCPYNQSSSKYHWDNTFPNLSSRFQSYIYIPKYRNSDTIEYAILCPPVPGDEGLGAKLQQVKKAGVAKIGEERWNGEVMFKGGKDEVVMRQGKGQVMHMWK